MKKFYIKQKCFSLNEKFQVLDDTGKVHYFVEGSLMKIQKSFTIFNSRQEQTGIIIKKIFSFLPKFFVEVEGNEILTITKAPSFFKDRYDIASEDIWVNGDWWNMNFTIFQSGKEIAKIKQKWLTWGDTYELEILNEEFEKIIVAIVIAIDCVKAEEDITATSIFF